MHLVLRHQLLLQAGGHSRVAGEFYAEAAVSAGQRLQARLVVGQLGQRDFTADHGRALAAAARTGAGDMAAPRAQIAGQVAAKLFSESLAAAGVTREQVTGWILHTGGRDVILSLRDHLELSDADVRHSAAILRDYGNMSSPTVYFVLERALRDSVPDGPWWMSAFGAGFSCHGAFLDVRQP